MNKSEFDKAEVMARKSHLKVIEATYHSEAFGSWHITVGTKPPRRLVWDGKDAWLFLQEETEELFDGRPVWKELWLAKKYSPETLRLGLNKLLNERA